MARRKQGGLDTLASLPWPVGIAVGIAGYWIIRHGIGLYFSRSDGPLGAAFSGEAFAPLAWLVLLACWAAAAASAFSRRKRKRLLETQTGLDSLRGMSWQEFEMLVGESFRRQGYSVKETGLGGKDGGIDLIVRKAGRMELVQCKQWRNRQVNVATVREMWGLKAHHHADAVHIVCAGEFTADAAAFASGKPIHLTTGQTLLELIQTVQTKPRPVPTAPLIEPAQASTAITCPVCGDQMVKRTNRRNRQSFMGCPQYPRCHGTRPVADTRTAQD